MRDATPQKNTKKKPSRSRNVIQGFFIVFALLFLVAFVQIFYFQIVQGKTLSQEAQDQRMRQIETPAKRGSIFDREGETLAVSVQAYNIIADPTLISRPRQSAELIASCIGGSTSDYYSKLRRQGKRRYSIVAKSVDAEKIELLKKKIAAIELGEPGDTASSQRAYKAEKNYKDGLRAMAYELTYKRTYPGNSVASQVVGFVNAENVGSAGLELYYNDLLKGTSGLSFSERDSHGNRIPAGIQRTIEAQDGNDIILTIDKDIQFFAEKELKKAVKGYDGIAGSVVVMNPKNGELYAAASYPTYNSNKFNKAKPENIKNRALTDLYEPGSTMKCVTIAGALENNAVTPKTRFSVPYALRVGTRTVKDSHPHGTQSLTASQIIEQSSNTGTTKIAQRLGKDALYNNFVNFGFTERPGVDFPGSSHGWLPKPSTWADVSLSNFSFGQGLSATPVQMTRAIGAIANKGILETPHLLKDIPSDPLKVTKWAQSRAISEKAASQSVDILKKVMTKGTGKTIKVKGYSVAGKTGTAQKAVPSKGYVAGKYMGSFIGFLPADDPQVVVLVVIDEPKRGYYGGTVAGGAFAEIAGFAARHLDIAPSKGVTVLKD